MRKRNSSRFRPVLLAVVAAVVLLPAWANAEGIKYDVGLGFQFATGQYGTGITTDAVFLPFMVEVFPTERLDFSLEIPLIYQSSSAVVAGEFAGMRQGAALGTMGAAMRSMTAVTAAMTGPGPRTNASPFNVNDSQFGIGDLKLGAGYVLYTEEKYVPAIRPNFFLKIPTAEKDKFLGTGAFDGGVGVELTKWFGKWIADGDIGYVFQGNSSVVTVKDYMYYDISAGYQVSPNLRPIFLLKGSTPTVDGASALLEARLRVKYQISQHIGIDGYVSKGITTASPDYGTGVALFYYF